jgi:hypothetical protein
MEIQHELDQCPVQPGKRTPQHTESGAGQTRRRLKIQTTHLLAEVDVIHRIELECRRLTPGAYFFVVQFIPTFRNRLLHQVRQPEVNIAQTGLDGFQLRLGLPERFTERMNRIHKRLGILTGGLRLANFPGFHIPLISQLFDLNLQPLPLVLQTLVSRHIKLESAPLQVGGNRFRLMA